MTILQYILPLIQLLLAFKSKCDIIIKGGSCKSISVPGVRDGNPNQLRQISHPVQQATDDMVQVSGCVAGRTILIRPRCCDGRMGGGNDCHRAHHARTGSGRGRNDDGQDGSHHLYDRVHRDNLPPRQLDPENGGRWQDLSPKSPDVGAAETILIPTDPPPCAPVERAGSGPKGSVFCYKNIKQKKTVGQYAYHPTVRAQPSPLLILDSSQWSSWAR